MKISPETVVAWTELKDSFEELQAVMDSPRNLAAMTDQLARAKVVMSDLDTLVTRLRREKNGE